ncbi:MAG: DUF3467 domain-containing protein [Thermodesulfobacteriota bacterium]
MAKKEEWSDEAKGAGGGMVQDTAQLKIRWDSSNMRSAYANVFNVAGTREEIVLFFGMNQSWDAAQKEVTVQLSDRIVLSPFVAKRLSLVLSNVVRDYESKYGKLDIKTRRPTDATET